MTDIIDQKRSVLVALTKPGCVCDHNDNLEAAQAITQARFALFKADSKVHPASYPPPPAGDGSEIFAAADEAGEGTLTFKEVAKYLGRNMSLQHRLREGWESFFSQFDTENVKDLDKAQFMAIWQKAAALRKD